MRFDDKLATILAQPLDSARARVAAWRQIVDVLAQMRGNDDPLSDEAWDLVRHLRDGVPLEVRREVARAIEGRPLPAGVVALIAGESPAIAAPLLGSVHLSSEEWLGLLPMLSPTARSLLRHRRDLPAEVVHALASFGPSDFALPAAAIAAAQDGPEPTVDAALNDGETQIRDLLARIATYREKQASLAATSVPPFPAEAEPTVEPPADDFRFETGPDGVIAWIEGAPRGALIGETIARAAERFDHGVDGHAAGAYRRRAPFRDARLSVRGEGSVGGEWRISAVPFFDPRDGRFTGYRGTARRPRPDEIAAPVGEGGLYGSGLQPDSLRQLVHELRTPLNAIVGFAEMIERQMLGPAAMGYRSRASEIAEQGRRLLGAVDDLDTAARIDTLRLSATSSPVDGAFLLARLHGEYEPGAIERGVDFHVRIVPDLPAIDGEPAAVERMISRLLAATIGLAERGESIDVTLDRSGGDGPIRLVVARPKLLEGRDEQSLLDPGYSPEGDWPDAPLLGLGFALRLIRNLAASIHGSLDVRDDAFVLLLPTAGAAALSGIKV